MLSYVTNLSMTWAVYQTDYQSGHVVRRSIHPRHGWIFSEVLEQAIFKYFESSTRIRKWSWTRTETREHFSCRLGHGLGYFHDGGHCHDIGQKHEFGHDKISDTVVRSSTSQILPSSPVIPDLIWIFSWNLICLWIKLKCKDRIVVDRSSIIELIWC